MDALGDTQLQELCVLQWKLMCRRSAEGFRWTQEEGFPRMGQERLIGSLWQVGGNRMGGW